MCSVAQRELPSIFPKPGWVEHDADEIWAGMLERCGGGNEQNQTVAADIATLGITNQRETTIVWDKTTGEPVYHAIVGQCRRTSEYCDSLKEKRPDRKIQGENRSCDRCFIFRDKVKWLLDQYCRMQEKKAEKENYYWNELKHG